MGPFYPFSSLSLLLPEASIVTLPTWLPLICHRERNIQVFSYHSMTRLVSEHLESSVMEWNHCGCRTLYLLRYNYDYVDSIYVNHIYTGADRPFLFYLTWQKETSQGQTQYRTSSALQMWAFLSCWHDQWFLVCWCVSFGTSEDSGPHTDGKPKPKLFENVRIISVSVLFVVWRTLNLRYEHWMVWVGL